MNQLLKYLIGLAVCVLFASTRAQEAYQPNCAETLKIKPWDFIESYAAKNNDQSEAGYDNAAIYWADCKAKENDKRLAKFPTLKKKLDNLYRNHNKFFNAETGLAYVAAGGGTVYPHGRARFQPSLEIHFGKLIDLLTTKAGATKSAAISARYSKAKGALERRTRRVQTTPKPYTEGYTKAEVTAKNREWLKYAKTYATQYANIRKNIGAGIDLASTTILEFLAAGLWASEIV
ncbi:MAG: hypothetical protein ACK41E_03315 [Deinococcales bacterium]